MSDEELKIYYRLILDVWQAMKSDLPVVQDNEAWWDSMIDKYAQITTKYEDTQAWCFAVHITKACLYEMERICNERRKYGTQN